MKTALAAGIALALFGFSVLGSRFTVHAAGDPLTIATLSSRPDMVSGGDALVEIRGATIQPGAAPNVSVKVNDGDVSAGFHVNAERKTLTGVVDGLKPGRNTIVAKAGSQTARLDVTNYPITGPIVSGDHLTPFVCKTVESGLGEPLDADCSAKTKVEYFYKSTQPPAAGGRGRGAAAGAFKPFDTAAPRPDDVAQTTIST